MGAQGQEEQITALVAAYRTPYDAWMVNEEYRREQYTQGLEMARRGDEVHIAINCVWSAKRLDGGFISSYETIGLHACTADLLRGWLDGGATIIDHRIEWEWLSCRCGADAHISRWEKNQGKCYHCGNDPLPLITISGSKNEIRKEEEITS